MPRLDYESVSQLLVGVEQIDHTLICRFRCPETGVEERSAVVLAGEDEDVPPQVDTNLLETVRSVVVTTIKAMFLSPGDEGACDETLEEARQEAIVAAFKAVRSQFLVKDGRWVHRILDERLGDFHRRLEASPVISAYDQQVLTRVLLEILKADGEDRATERKFLNEIIPDQTTVERLFDAPPITLAELAEVSRNGERETILLLAWALAYADEELDPAELKRLADYARGFMLPESRIRELHRAARLFVVDRALSEVYADGKVDDDELERVYSLANRLDITGTDLEQLEEALKSANDETA